MNTPEEYDPFEWEDSHLLMNEFAEYLKKQSRIDWYQSLEEHLQRQVFDEFIDKKFLGKGFYFIMRELMYQTFLAQKLHTETLMAITEDEDDCS